MTVSPAMQRIEDNLREHFGGQLDQIERAVQRFRDQERRLLRPDGSRIYADAEHQSRVDALLAEFDGMCNSVREASAAAIEESQGTLAQLDGATPLDRLTAEQQQAASVRAPFVKEDSETLPLSQLDKRARAALAGGNTVDTFLLARYLEARLARESRPGRALSPQDAAAFGTLRELQERLADPKATARRATAERRIEAAKMLPFRIRQARGPLDGSDAAVREQMRQRYRL